jgi:signal transduction histidine kinase
MKHHRVILAALLTLIALGVPTAAWYVVGSREVEQRAQQVERDTLEAARHTAVQLAERLRTRLESVREAEAQRPFYHYQFLYHEPKGAYQGQSVIPSPLNGPPSDSIIRSYFQVDGKGNLTTPNYSEQLPELNAVVQTKAQAMDNKTVRDELQPIVPSALLFNDGRIVADREESSWYGSVRKQPQQQVAPQQSEPMRYEVLEEQAYRQNVEATQVYQELKTGNVASRAGNKPVSVAVNPLDWRTVPFGADKALVAMRRVTTPQDVLAQGFLVSQTALQETLSGAAYPARCVPTESVPSAHGLMTAAIGATGWSVVLDARDALASLPVNLGVLRTNFRRWFLAGVGAVVLAGVCVILLVWQSDRLARQRSQFAASAAHELRTPLAGLRMYSEMLAEGLGDPGKARDYARVVADEAARLGRVVSNVLNFSRLERGKLNIRPQPGDLADAVRECVERQRPALEAMGASVVLNVADGLPSVAFDRDALAEIMQNLLDNAEKHTRGCDHREIQVAIAKTDDHVDVSVSDRGHGVAMDVQRRLFRPFERGNHVDGPAGLGLGLTLVLALMRGHKGTVAYRNNEGGGAVFVARFPLR